MKKKLFSIMLLMLFVVSTLYLRSSFAQDSAHLNQDLPAGAKIRIILSHDVIKHRTEKPFYESLNAVEGVVFSPDGQTLATTSDRSPIHLWNAITGEYKQTLRKYTANIVNIYREQYQPWSTLTPKKKPFGSNLAFSPDGGKFANGGKNKTVRVWNTATGIPKYFRGHTDYVSSVAFSPDGETLVSGSVDKTIRLWDAATGRQKKTITGHTDYISSVAFSPNGKILVSGSGDGTIRLWEASTGKHQKTLTGHTDGIFTIVFIFSQDGTMLVSAGIDGTVRVWDITTGEQKNILAGRKGTNWSVSFNAAGRIFACDNDHFMIRIWDVVTGQRVQTFMREGTGIYSSAVSPDGLTLATGFSNRRVILWDLTPIVDVKPLRK